MTFAAHSLKNLRASIQKFGSVGAGLQTRPYPLKFTLILFLLLFTLAVHAQDTQPTSGQPAFLAYRCDFDKPTNSVQVYASLMNPGGQSLPVDAYTVTATNAATSQILPATSITKTTLLKRNPVKLVLVLDTTDTVPVDEMVTAIRTKLLARLDANDEVAVQVFNSEVLPLSLFYTNKDNLVTEQLLNLKPIGGKNKLYDAIFEATKALKDVKNQRHVVLVLTDSSRTDTVQTSSDAIVSLAQSAKTQIYPIGFFSRDRPDQPELFILANATRGYGWLYDDKKNSRASIQTALEDRLDRFLTTLNSEALLTIDMQGQTPDANGQVVLNLNIAIQNGANLTDQINCPLQVLNHSIAFGSDLNNAVLIAPTDITVNVQTDLNRDRVHVVFWLNDQPVQSTDNPLFLLDVPNLAPGAYVLKAQLRDKNDNILATTTRTMKIFVQQPIQLNPTGGSLADLSQPLQLEASANPTLKLPNAQFTLSSAKAPTVSYPFGAGSVPFQNGKAVLKVDDPQAEIKRRFPDAADGDVFQITTTIPGAAPGDPPLATSVLPLTYRAPSGDNAKSGSNTAVGVAFVLRPTVVTTAGVSVILALLNLLLIFRVGRARIRRIIDNPDRHDLSTHLMAVTVRQGGTRHTHLLTKKTITIGRGSSNDINLGDDPNISRQHGVIIWRKKDWYYSNRKSGVKSRIDGKRFTGYKLCHLEPVTEIEIGDAQLIFHSNAQQDISEFIKTNL